MRRALLILLALASCRDDLPPPVARAVEPPVASPEAIPDALVSGRIHGAPFVLRSARYLVDRRPGYAHTDIELSSGTTDSPCTPVSPVTATSVWLRLEGPDRVTSTSLRVGPATATPWTVHYQVFENGAWRGVGEGSALVVLHEAGPDGRVSGGVAVCFSDDAKSCVSGSFDAIACPSHPQSDRPRGAPSGGDPAGIPAEGARRGSVGDSSCRPGGDTVGEASS